MLNIPFGVYIGKDIEIIYTEKYTMVFRRNGEMDFLESLLLNSEMLCIGICKTAPCGTEMSFKPDSWKYALQREKAICSDAEIKGYFGKHVLTLSETAGTLSIKFYDGATYEAHAHELFTMEQLLPACKTPNESTIADCLQTWNVSCREIQWNNEYIGVIMNTYKHMYIFEMTKGSVYCRAARYLACDQGVVFNQNFRQGLNAYMIPDNRDAMNDLEYDKSLFNNDSCAWNDRSVYWSVASVGQDRIELHGCQGDQYEWRKPR